MACFRTMILNPYNTPAYQLHLPCFCSHSGVCLHQLRSGALRKNYRQKRPYFWQSNLAQRSKCGTGTWTHRENNSTFTLDQNQLYGSYIHFQNILEKVNPTHNKSSVNVEIM